MTRDDEWKLTGATRQSDGLGRPAVGFSLDGLGAKLLGDLTGPNVGRNMAVLLDGKLKTAPNLLGRLSNGGQITGEFSQSELQYLIRTLGAGSLEGQLSADPIAQKTTGPALGADNLRKGLRACVMSLIAVSILMAIYYFFAGLVADFALLANIGADHRHGGGRQRADLRAHPRRAERRGETQRVDPPGLWQGAVDHPRRQHHHPDHLLRAGLHRHGRGQGLRRRRGQDLFDIEFRSGTEVTFNLAEGQSMPLAEARERLAAFADDPEAARLKEESEAKAAEGPR